MAKIEIDKIRKQSPVLNHLLENLEEINKKKGEAEILVIVLERIETRISGLRFRRINSDKKQIILRELLEIRKTIRNIARVKHIELN